MQWGYFLQEVSRAGIVRMKYSLSFQFMGNWKKKIFFVWFRVKPNKLPCFPPKLFRKSEMLLFSQLHSTNRPESSGRICFIHACTKIWFCRPTQGWRQKSDLKQLAHCNTDLLNQLVVSTFEQLFPQLSSEDNAKVLIRIHPDALQKTKLTFGLESLIPIPWMFGILKHDSHCRC